MAKLFYALINEAAFLHWQAKHFRAVDSFAASAVHHIVMTGTVLHNIIVSEDLIGYSGFWEWDIAVAEMWTQCLTPSSERWAQN